MMILMIIMTNIIPLFKQGSENDIRAKFYSIAFQIVYDEDEGVAEWKIVDYQFAGETPYY